MSPTERNKNDTKLLLSVAGLVVAGAAGIALLAGFAADRQAKREAGEQARSSPQSVHEASSPMPEEVPVQLASFTPEAEAEVEAAIEPEVPAAFVVDPSENFVARAIETYDAREFDKAVAYLSAEIDARPQRAWTHYMLGLSLWKSGRADEAVAAMEMAAKLNPEGVKTFVNLSRIQNDRHDYDAALAAAREALAIDPGHPSARFLEARSLTNLGLTDEALAALEASLAADPDNGYAHNLLGLILLRQDDEGAAVGPLTRAAELQPDVAFIQNNLGMALERTGDREGAVAAYRRAVEIDAGHATAATHLARLEPTLPPRDAVDAGADAVAVVPDVVEVAEGAIR